MVKCAITTVCSLLLGIGILCAVDKPAQESLPTASTQTYPISFDSQHYHVTAAFPIPSKEIEQRDSQNKMYIAQGVTETDPAGLSLVETYSVLYQSLTPKTGDKPVTALDLAQQFEKTLGQNEGVTVKELSIHHEAGKGDYNQQYIALEVIDHARTDYYLMRIITFQNGVIVAVHTMQKGMEPIDLSNPSVWAFLDSVALTSKTPHSSEKT